LVAAEHWVAYERGTIASGLAPLDALLGGGLTKGSSTLIIGPAGTGKSSLATQYTVAAAARGDHSSFFLFDESLITFREPSAGLGFGVDALLERNALDVRQVDPAELSPGEFAHVVRRTVEKQQSSRTDAQRPADPAVEG
jgi:circadian clock protein KaiC